MNWISEKYLKMISGRLQLFKPKKRGVYNCRCPICGDSQKSKTKARGYFYTRKGKMFYDCKNCGAPEHRTFDKFLKWFDADFYKEYKMEVFKESVHHTKEKKVNELNFNYSKPEAKEVPEVLKHLKSLKQLGEGHVAWMYAEGRGIPTNQFSNLYFAASMNVFSKLIPDYEETKFDDIPRLILPFINKDGIVTHIQGRAIGDAQHVPKSQRYVTLELVPDISKVFGMNTIDESKTVKVVEGPIDSLFLKNCAAMAGADIDFSLFNKDKTAFIFDNEPRSHEIIRRMETVINKGFGVCVWGNEINSGDDINDLILKEFTPDELDAYIESRTFRGLKAKMELAKYKKI